MNKLIARINYLYSMVWIRVHKSDKFEYREKSRLHKLLMEVVR